MAAGTADLLEMEPGENEMDLQKTDEQTRHWRRPSLATGSASSLLVELDLLAINCSAPDWIEPGLGSPCGRGSPGALPRASPWSGGCQIPGGMESWRMNRFGFNKNKTFRKELTCLRTACCGST